MADIIIIERHVRVETYVEIVRRPQPVQAVEAPSRPKAVRAERKPEVAKRLPTINDLVQYGPSRYYVGWVNEHGTKVGLRGRQSGPMDCWANASACVLVRAAN